MSNVNDDKLLDGFYVNGTDYDEFMARNSEMADRTKEITVRGGDCFFLSLCEPMTEKYLAEENKVAFYLINQEYLTAFNLTGRMFPLCKFDIESIGTVLLDELRLTTGLMIWIGNDKSKRFVVSDYANTTLSQRAGVKGDTTATRQNLLRNAHYADAIISRNEEITFVYREIETVCERTEKTTVLRKIFSAMGTQFVPVRQTILADTKELVSDKNVLGNTKVREWEIGQEFTSIYMEFPDAAEDMATMYDYPDALTPGIYITTSDIGSSSIIARGVLAKGASYVITDEVAVQHKGQVTAADIMSKIDMEIFPNIRKLPETLSFLIGQSVCDYAEVDLSTDAGCEANMKAVSDCIEECVDSALTGVFGAKKRRNLTECLESEVNAEIPYTLYDIAITFMGIAERIEGLKGTLETEVRQACGKVPYMLEKKAGRKSKNDDDDNIIVLSM